MRLPPADCQFAMRLPIPSDHAPVPLSEYYPELPVPIRELLLYFARHGRDLTPKCAASTPKYVAIRIPPLHELPPAVVTAELQLTERSSTAMYNVARVENIHPASLSITELHLKERNLRG